MTLLERIHQDYQKRIDMINQMMNLPNSSAGLAAGAAMLYAYARMKTVDYAELKEDYEFAIANKVLCNHTSGYTNYKNYVNYNITSTTYIVWKHGRNRYGVEELLLEKDGDITTVWYIPYHNKLVLPHLDDRLEYLNVDSVKDMEWFFACLYDVKL